MFAQFHLAWSERNIRWSLCAAEYCFQQKAALEAYFGAGHTIPIKRGLGIDQPLFLDFARQVAAGKWVHVFPEGGVYQGSSLGGGRPPERSQAIGKLKWGVAKLIAHSPKTAIVVPFVHMGMEQVVPIDPKNRKTERWLPFPGKTITIHVGGKLDFSELIKEHEATYGVLWKFSENSSSSNGANWISNETDYILYNKIMTRIEETLERIHETALKGANSKYHDLSLKK